MNHTIKRGGTALALSAFLLMGASGCAGMGNKEKGAVIGAATGGVVGGVIGKHQGSTSKGAIIGAVIGGAAGAVIGHQMDQKAKEMEAELDNAEVERVGEGILVTFDSGILFDFDSSRLRPQARENLTELVGVLGERRDDYELLIAGHTDATGEEDYNYSLSERRAQAAADYLASQGIPPARMNLVGLGESEPVASNETAAGRQENRRVEVAIYASEEYREEITRTGGTQR